MNPCDFLCQTGTYAVRVMENVISTSVLLLTENTDWLHIGSLFTGDIVGWVEGYVGLSLLVL